MSFIAVFKQKYERIPTGHNFISDPFSRPFRARVFRFASLLLPPPPPRASADGFRSFRQKVAFLPGRAILIAVLRLKKITAICDNIASSSLFVAFTRAS